MPRFKKKAKERHKNGPLDAMDRAVAHAKAAQLAHEENHREMREGCLWCVDDVKDAANARDALGPLVEAGNWVCREGDDCQCRCHHEALDDDECDRQGCAPRDLRRKVTAEKCVVDIEFVTAANLEGLARSGHVPHWSAPDGSLWFDDEQTWTWLHRHYVVRCDGAPFPRVMVVDAGVPATENLPPSLRNLAGYLRRAPIASGVYFLLYEGEVVYIGQTRNIATRVHQHFTDRYRKFSVDDAVWLPVPTGDLERIESAFIRMLRPPHNGKGTISWDVPAAEDEAAVEKVLEMVEQDEEA